MEALKDVAVTNEPVIHEVVKYKAVMEEIVFIEKDLSAVPIKANDMIGEVLIAGSLKAEENIDDGRNAEVRNAEPMKAMHFKDTSAEDGFTDTMIDEAGNFEAMPLEDLIAEVLNGESVSEVVMTDEAATDGTLTDDEATISVDLDQLTQSNDHKQKWLAHHKRIFNIEDFKLPTLDLWKDSKCHIIECLVKEAEDPQQLSFCLDQQNLEIDEDHFLGYENVALEKDQTSDYLDELQELQPQTPIKQKKQMARIKISATSTPLSTPQLAKQEMLQKLGRNGTTMPTSELTVINWALQNRI